MSGGEEQQNVFHSAPVAHLVERVPLRLRPDHRDPGLNPISYPWSLAECPPLHLLYLPNYLTL